MKAASATCPRSRDGKIRLTRRELLPFPEGPEGDRARERIQQAREAGPPTRSGGGGRDRRDGPPRDRDEALHWNGTKWTSTSVKNLLPAALKSHLNDPTVTGILALSSTNVLRNSIASQIPINRWFLPRYWRSFARTKSSD